MDENTLSKHLHEQLRLIQKKLRRKWFTKDEALFLYRTDWVIKKLLDAGALQYKLKGEVLVYRAQKCKHYPYQYGIEPPQCLYCGQKLGNAKGSQPACT